jgi:tetratricopeptide (TPR) repeat protein
MRSILLMVSLFAGAAAPAWARQAPPQTAESAGPEYHYMVGRYLESAGRIEDAVAAFRRAIDLDPKSAELRAELAGLYARQDNAIAAVEHAEAALALDPANEEASRILGTVYAAYAERRLPVRQGDDPSTYVARAIAALEKAVGDGTDLGLSLVLGRLYLQSENFAKAVPLLARVVDERPEFVDAAILLATAQEGAGQVAPAIATLEEVLRGNPRSYRAQLRLAEIYERKEQWNEAADAFGKAQALNPRASMLTTRRAVALLSAGRAAEAKELVQGAVAAGRPEASDPVLLYLLAESQRVLKELDAAQATAQKLLAANKDDLRALHVLSLILQDKGDVQGAERTLRDLIARDPIDANALNSLGYMLADRGEQLDEAVLLLQRALKIEPDNPAYHDSLGWAYFQRGQLERADPHLTEAARKLQTNSVVQDHLGDLRFKQQRYSDAAAAWERALSGDGQSIDRAKIERKLRDARGRM